MQKHNNFSEEFFKNLTQKIEIELSKSLGPHFAAFDADGTLWEFDLGESFFKYQIENKLIELPPNPWKHYRDWKESGDPRPAYLWLAQVNKGQKLTTVQKWADDCVASLAPVPIFEGQKRLIEFFQKRSIPVFIVTASVKWSVEAGAKLLNIPIENVIGVSTKIKNGIITDEQEGIITYRSGKVEALLQKTNGIKPIFASGNSMGDSELLKSAKVALAVSSAALGHELYDNEQKLYTEAKANKWLTHRF